MSKNMTRKGLAFGAGAALVVSGLAAVPAQAANVSGISLDAHFGPSDNFVAIQGAGRGLVLETELTNIGNTSARDLKYKVDIVSTTDLQNWDDIDGANDIVGYTVFASAVDNTGDNDDEFVANAVNEAQIGGSLTSRVMTPTNMGANRVFGISSGNLNNADTSAASAITVVVPGHNIKVGETVTLANVSDKDGVGNMAGAYTVDAVTINSVSMSEAANDAAVDAAGAMTVAANATIAAVGVPAIGETNLLYLEVPVQQELDADTVGEEPIQFTVTAWIDNDGNGVIGANEYASPTRTVTFLAEDDVVVSHSFDYFTVGDPTLSGQYGFGTVNGENLVEVLEDVLGYGYRVELDDATDGNPVITGNTNGTAGSAGTTNTYNVLTNQFEYTLDNADGIDLLVDGANDGANLAIAAEAYEAVLYYDDDATAGGNAAEPGNAAGNGNFAGNESDTNITRTASASGLNKMEIVATSSTTINQTATANSLIEEANTIELLTGTTSIPVTIDLYTAATVRAGSGIEVEVTLTDDTNKLDTTTLTVEGKTLTAKTVANAVSFTKKTDANGRISFTIAADEGADGESFLIDAKAGDKSISQTTVKWADRVYKLVQTPDTNFTIDTQGSVTVEYTVVDQFGQVPTGDYQLAFTRARSSGLRTDAKGTTANWSYVAPLSDTGRASVTIVDNGSATVEGVDQVTVTLQKAATGGTGFVAEPNHTADTFNVTYETDLDGISTTAQVSNNGVELVDGTAVYPVALEAKTLKNVDTRFGDLDPKYSDTNAFDDKDNTTADNLLRVYGTVTDTDNDGVSGVAVELSAAGLNFASANTSAGSAQMLNDSLVLTTDANGLWQAWVRSSVSGKQTISVNAQGATGSVDVTFEGSTGTAAAMTLDTPASVVDGRTGDVKVKVTDKLGNPVAGVAVTFKETGPGYLNTNSGSTDADGEVIVNLITVAGDTGNSTITASATVDGKATSVVKTVVVGAVASDQKVNAGSFKGYVALYAKGYAGQRMSAKVGKDWVVVPALASNFERVVEFTGAGVDVAVRIYIDRVLMDTINLTTK